MNNASIAAIIPPTEQRTSLRVALRSKSMPAPGFILRSSAIVVAAWALATGVYAQNYPIRAVRLIVPCSPGGAADVPARIITQKLSEGLAQQVLIDNRPGAGSTIGADQVAKAAPDGYTLLLTSNTHFV